MYLSKKWKLVFVLLAAAFTLAASCLICLGCSTQSVDNNKFEYWNTDAASLNEIKEYVSDVTNKDSKNYIPEQDRIAVFDVDGTLYGELAPIYVEWCMYVYRVLYDNTYQCNNPDMIRLANEIIEAGKTKTIPENIEKEHANYAQVAFSGMTIKQYCEYVQNYLKQPAQGFENATYADMWYLPMISIIDYLNKNNFQVYAVSGTDRYMIRTMLKDKGIDISENHVIGMDCQLVVDGKESQDLLDYQYKPEDKIVRSSKLLVKNVKMNKAARIATEIGKQPVLAFGNSSGDTSMCNYVTSNNKYKAAAFMLVADDDQRDYGNLGKAQKAENTWKSNGWNCISMKNDFLTIYDSKVKKAA